jgi:hypothetical protein
MYHLAKERINFEKVSSIKRDCVFISLACYMEYPNIAIGQQKVVANPRLGYLNLALLYCSYIS